MRFEETRLAGVVTAEAEPHLDDRGAFLRTFCEREFEAAGLPTRFPQCNLSSNRRRGTLRGMHYNAVPHRESKLVRCVRGAIHDVVVDLRPDSPTCLDWLAVELSAENRRALFVPEGFAHGFMTLCDDSDVHYHMGELYVPEAARGFRWDDPAVGIEWPFMPEVLSTADSSHPDLDPAAIAG